MTQFEHKTREGTYELVNNTVRGKADSNDHWRIGVVYKDVETGAMYWTSVDRWVDSFRRMKKPGEGKR